MSSEGNLEIELSYELIVQIQWLGLSNKFKSSAELDEEHNWFLQRQVKIDHLSVSNIGWKSKVMVY